MFGRMGIDMKGNGINASNMGLGQIFSQMGMFTLGVIIWASLMELVITSGRMGAVTLESL